MNISIRASRATIEPNGYKIVTVEIEDVEESEILDNFKIEDVISHFSTDDILQAIGKQEAIDYFGIEEKEE